MGLCNRLGEGQTQTYLATRLPARAADLDKRLSAYLAVAKAQLPEANPQSVDGKTYSGKSGGKERKKEKRRN